MVRTAGRAYAGRNDTRRMNARELSISGRRCRLYAADAAEFLLVQPVDRQELASLDDEVAAIRSFRVAPFGLAAFEIADWQHELSPWAAPPVFGKVPFGNGAGQTLAFVVEQLLPHLSDAGSYSAERMSLLLGGYSLAGLFALWAAYQTDLFCGIAAASPSVWFPGWTDYAATRCPQAEAVYLSLGDREEHTRNPLMRQVGDAIRWQHQLMEQQTRCTTLEWNAGNHFVDAEKRMARGFAWLMGTLRKKL